MRSRHAGFTIIEVMIVVGIVAHTALSDFRVQMEQFYQDNRTYDDGGGNCGAAAPAGLKYFTFGCALAGGDAYTATVTGKATDGTAGFAFTIDQGNNKTTTVSSPASANGWSSNGACWVRAKANVC